MNTVRKNGYSRIGIIAMCCMVYFVSYFSRKDFAAVMAEMASVGAINRENGGLIGTMLFIFYGTGQLISGYLGDKIRPKYLIILGLSVTGLCNACMSFVPEGMMFFVWGLNGLAQAMLWPPIVKILAQYLDHKTYVTAHLAVTSAAHVATVLLYVFVPFCITFMSWKSVFITASSLAFLSMAIFAVVMRLILPADVDETAPVSRKTEDTDAQIGEKRSIISIMRESGIFTVFVCIIVIGFLRDGIESWMPTLYSEAFGKSVSESTLVSIILPIFSIISITVITALHKKGVIKNEVSGTAALFGLSLICAVPLAFFVSMKGTFFGIAALLLTALICGAMHGANFLLISCLPGRFSRFGRAATVSGVCNSCVYIGAAVSTYGIALISKQMGWPLTIATWSAILIIGIVFGALSYRRYTALIKNENNE